MRKVSRFLLFSFLFALFSAAHALQDPTQPADYLDSGPLPPSDETAPAPQAEWVLSSTLVARERRLAVINGQLVKEGDTLDGAQVVGITPLAVQLKTAQGALTLNLLPAGVKISKVKRPISQTGASP